MRRKTVHTINVDERGSVLCAESFFLITVGPTVCLCIPRHTA